MVHRVQPGRQLVRSSQLVDPAWVSQLLQGQRSDTYTGHRFVVCEVSWGAGDVCQSGHIPGAQLFALQACEQAPGWTRVADALLVAELCAHGITSATTVVLYGRDTTAVARAAVLMLYAGVDDVRLLNGGWRAWQAAGYAVSSTLQLPVPVAEFGRSFPAHPEYLLDTVEVQSLLAEDNVILVSVQSWAEYVGATSGYAYIQRTGRIAGAVWGHAESAPHRMDYYRHSDNTMRCAAAIASYWRAWGITPNKRVVFYCGTGWRASEAFFYAYLMGWPTVAVYDGGWWQWSQDPTNPIAQGTPRRLWRSSTDVLA